MRMAAKLCLIVGRHEIIDDVVLQVVSTGWISDALSKAASGEGEGLTEAQLSEELGGRELPPGYANASKTISWWRQRQVGRTILHP